jgi:multidrug efflux pump subunit AcrA (membrane-fusion protein)
MMKAPRMAGPAQDTYLADALGTTAEALQTAQQEAAEAGIDQAVADGLITEAQAELIKERGSRFMGMIGKFGRLGGTADIDHEALLAEALDITVEDLQAAQAEAKDTALAQAVEDGKITQEQVDDMNAMKALHEYLQEQGLQDSMRSMYSDALQGAVDASVITQEQADKLLEAKAGFGMRAPGGRSMRGFGGHGMPSFDKGDFRGRFNGQGFAPRGGTETAPTAFSF